MIDCCFDSLSGLTSQPSMGAIVNALSGTELDTGIDPKLILPLSTYWEQVTPLLPASTPASCVSTSPLSHDPHPPRSDNDPWLILPLFTYWERICRDATCAVLSAPSDDPLT